MTSTYVSRINQLDALQLDNEIHRIFTDKIHEILRLFTPGVTENWSPEITAALRSLIWAFSLGSGKSTFGQKLFHLSYRNLTKKKALLFLLFSVTPKYLEDKYLDPHRVVNPRHRNLIQILEWTLDFFTLLNLINLFIFLNRGTQPSILERFLGISSRNNGPNRPRTIGYSYMTRELVWHGLMELFSVALPMINFQYLKRLFVSRFGRSNKSVIEGAMIPRMTKRSLCPHCEETPVLPYVAGCSHIYCYYCIAGLFRVSSSFDCLGCGKQLWHQDLQAYSV